MARKEIKIFMDAKEAASFLKLSIGPGCSAFSVSAITFRSALTKS